MGRKFVLTVAVMDVAIALDVDIAVVGGPLEGGAVVRAHAAVDIEEPPPARNLRRFAVLEKLIRA